MFNGSKSEAFLFLCSLSSIGSNRNEPLILHICSYHFSLTTEPPNSSPIAGTLPFESVQTTQALAISRCDDRKRRRVVKPPIVQD